MELAMDYFLGGEGALKPARAAAALIVVDHRYLLQLRDQKPGLFYPGHWGLFGGACDPGEAPDDALRRELHEELGLSISSPRHVTDFTFAFGRFGTVARHFFEVSIPFSVFTDLVLGEGSGMRLFKAAEILNLPRVVPYDSFALWLHASGQFET
jgi:8-oxo-dGTP pyrophosphatase MutT (NUDIX family)